MTDDAGQPESLDEMFARLRALPDNNVSVPYPGSGDAPPWDDILKSIGRTVGMIEAATAEHRRTVGQNVGAAAH